MGIITKNQKECVLNTETIVYDILRNKNQVSPNRKLIIYPTATPCSISLNTS